jgi:Na+-translocating ferredoxin:NAD+ oxidoreductase subunit G
MRRTIAKASVVTALNLLFFALIGTALLAIIYQLTHEPIARSEEAEKLKLVTQIAPSATYDNDIIKDTAELAADKLLGNDDTTVAYLGRLKGQPSIAVMQVIAPDGYSGKISLIIAIYSDGRIGGVRVISHKETPGLGDYIEIARNKWITGFDGSSLDNPKDSDWKVKKDGGAFDYMAGATITPRAVVKAVHKALQYYAQHRDELFKPHPPAKIQSGQSEGEKK